MLKKFEAKKKKSQNNKMSSSKQQTPSPAKQNQNNNNNNNKQDQNIEHDEHGRKKFYAPGVKSIVNDNLTAISIEHWAGDESAKKKFDAKVFRKKMLFICC